MRFKKQEKTSIWILNEHCQLYRKQQGDVIEQDIAYQANITASDQGSNQKIKIKRILL